MFIEMQAWLSVLMRVGKQTTRQMNDKIRRAAMTRVLNLRDVLELVNNRFDDRSLA